MKKSLILFATSTLLLLSACSPDANNLATSEYVDAAQKAKKASLAFEAADFEKSLTLFKQAKSQVENIPTKYPSTTIALKLVSEENVKLGDFKIEQIENIIEKLEIITLPTNKEISRTVAVAEIKYEHNSLHECIKKSQYFSAEQKNAIIASSPELTKIAKELKIAKIQKVNSQNLKSKISQDKSEKKNLSAEELKKLLNEAEKNAAHCAFEISASQALLNKSVFIGKEHLADFSKILRKGFSRAKIITIEKLREKAYANLATAAAKAGDENLALEIISQIKDSIAFETLFSELASTLGKTKNYPAALSIASNLKDSSLKDSFLAELSQNVALQGKFAAAIEIAKSISNISNRNNAIAQIAIYAYDTDNKKDFLSAITNLDISNLDFSKKFAKYTDNEEQCTLSESLATLAKMTIPLNVKIAKILTDIAKKQYQSEANKIQIIEQLIIENLIALNFVDEAYDFVSTSSFPILRVKFAISIISKNKQLTLKILKESQSEVNNITAFTFLVETSPLTNEEKTSIVKNFLQLK